MSEIAFLDESRRGKRYLLAAALIDHQAVATVRQTVRALAPRDGPTRRHFVRESDTSRRKCLAAYRALEGVTVLIYEHRGDGLRPVQQLAERLELMSSELVGRNIDRLVLDHVDDAQRRRDRQLLGRRLDGTGISYSHELAHSTEPLLWLPDAAAWCAGRPVRTCERPAAKPSGEVNGASSSGTQRVPAPAVCATPPRFTARRREPVRFTGCSASLTGVTVVRC